MEIDFKKKARRKFWEESDDILGWVDDRFLLFAEPGAEAQAAADFLTMMLKGEELGDYGF